MDGWWSETAIFEGAPPASGGATGWGISVSRTGEIHLSAINTANPNSTTARDTTLVKHGQHRRWLKDITYRCCAEAARAEIRPTAVDVRFGDRPAAHG